MKINRLVFALVLTATTLNMASCRPAKCASLDAGDVKIRKHKKASMDLFSKRERRRKKW